MAARATREHGFSLVELLIAMTLGLILIGGLVVAFAGNERAHRTSSAMATMQENVRFALEAIAADLRQAGHQGCLDLNSRSVAVIATPAPTTDLSRSAVSGTGIVSAGSWSPKLAAGGGTFIPPATKPGVAGTHAIALQFGGPDMARLRTSMQSDGVDDVNASLSLDGDLGLRAGDHALVSTCERGEVFGVSAATRDASGRQTLSHAASHNTSGSFAQAYGAGRTAAQVRVMPFRTHVYYVGETGRTDDRGEPIRALYQQSMPFGDAANPAVELVPGIENLRVGFGIGGVGRTIRHVSADATGYDPSSIVSVRIGVLASSFDYLSQDDDTTIYTLAGESVASATNPSDASAYKSDRRLRLAFNTTVKIRNRRAIE